MVSIFQARPPSRREFTADGWVHVIGVTLGVAGAALLVARMSATGIGHAVPALIYAFTLISMLGCSAAYNLTSMSRPQRRAFLRRFDHAAIFLLIAGTYTPFVAPHLDGGIMIAMTSLVWIVALAGAVMKLAFPRRFDRLSIVVYLALGWVALAAFGQITAQLDQLTIALLLAGGAIYSVGVGFYVWKTLPFQKAVWHVFVLVAAGCHYAAVLRAVA